MERYKQAKEMFARLGADTEAALHALHADADFPIGKAQKAFGYAPRPLEETVRDHARYLAEQGWVKL